MLININIITSKNINLIIFKKINYINSYYIIFKLLISLLRPFIKRDVVLKNLILILIYSYIIIRIKYIKLFDKDNFIFKSSSDYLVTLFVAIIDLSFYAILARNNIDKLILLLRKMQVSAIINLNINKYYYINDIEEA